MQHKENVSMCTFYAVSPIHAGSGASTSVVDLPIQRERHTQWPHVQASAVKGALRAHYRIFAEGDLAEMINLIFGSDKENDKNKKGAKDDIPAAVAVSDAKLLAMPVRSNVAPFVWVTSPAVLKRFMRDLAFLGRQTDWEIPDVQKDDAIVLNGEIAGTVILEEAVVEVKGANTDNPLSRYFKDTLERLLLVSDEMYDYVVTSCTEVQTQIKIDAEKGTTSDGSLRYEELLPSDSFLYALVYFNPKHEEHFNEFQQKNVQDHIKQVITDYTQIGGDETLGRGICKIEWLEGGN